MKPTITRFYNQHIVSRGSEGLRIPVETAFGPAFLTAR
jgi:hypothetical protein